MNGENRNKVSVTPEKQFQTSKSALELIQCLKETASEALDGTNKKLDQSTLLLIQKEIYERLKPFEREDGLKITSESLFNCRYKKVRPPKRWILLY
ncbi:hypothetical protein H5P36_25005 [Bacillus sp. APMAM]|nr:hypothetical protein [Bacillus sp. APMAM]RTZ53148.1 hypothetical protein EKO25_24940 [Bacillus sp. SAJ1]